MLEFNFMILIFCVFFVVRDVWVLKQRLSKIYWDGDEIVLDRYISRDRMFFRFWCWDVEKMKK